MTIIKGLIFSQPISGKYSIDRVELFNIQGQKIESFSREDIDLFGKRIHLKFDRKVSKGTYLLHIITSEKWDIRKLIIN